MPSLTGRLQKAARRLQERRRLEQLGAQAPLLAQVLAAHLRAGRSLRQAVGESAEHLPQPMREAVERAAATVALGGSPGEALAGLGDHPDLCLLAAAVDMQARFGGDLPMLLEDMSGALHERAAAARAARVATAQARATGRIVSVMPVLAVAALWAVDRPAALLLVGTWPGWLALALSAGMTACGQLLVGRLSRVDP
jgi:tight adherence protein B